MAKSKEPINPFYVVLVILGIVFFVTACAYGTMAYRAISPNQGDLDRHELMDFLDQNGVQLMGAELGLLAFATFAAMWLDGFRTRQMQTNQPAESKPQNEDEPGRRIE